MKCNRLAFTLIEVVIVLAIIAILVSLLFPVFSLARKRVENTTCLSNLKQIGMAISLYSSDADGLYPYACNLQDIDDPIESMIPPDTLAHMSPFNTVLEPYVRSMQIWKCPLDTEDFFNQFGTSYRYNDLLIYPDFVFDPDPSKVPLAYDGSMRWHTDEPSTFTDMDYVNVIFSDDHVKRDTWFNATVFHTGPG